MNEDPTEHDVGTAFEDLDEVTEILWDVKFGAFGVHAKEFCELAARLVLVAEAIRDGRATVEDD